MPNRLARESSPYLLQHRDNPVDWYPWGDEALARARAENKPIILSIGYSACHWCHVMEHESFENAEIARQMNESFVCIKVDREERPDLDQIYQGVAQAITQGGGWPLTVFLTPELKPFFGGTYYPPEDRYGRPGFPRVLRALSEAFRNEPEGIAENAERLTEFVASQTESPGLPGRAPDREGLESASEALLRGVDWENGGIGGPPKFPNPMMQEFLWRFGAATKSEAAMAGVLLTATKMASGGIYDQIGGGFHRYSVDETWSVPHFEKMLYDNGLLLKHYAQLLLSDSVLITPGHRALFTNVLRQTVDYLLREMRSPEGAFFAAQDADSEGEEGKYFVWDPGDLSKALSDEEASLFSLRFGVGPNGNFEHGKTVLHLSRGLDEIAGIVGKSPDEAVAIIDGAARKLLAVRETRIRPATDTKVLASWNGLVISGLGWAARALEGTDHAHRAREAAATAFGFLAERLAREGDRLYSTFQNGGPKLNAYLDDYAFLAAAALDLARFESDAARLDGYLEHAERWMDTVRTRFKDSTNGGYYFTSDDHEALIHRPKTSYDQAIPSGTGVVLGCLTALGEIDRHGQGARFAQEADEQLRAAFPVAARRPHGYGELLNASLLHLMGPIVVSGENAPALCRHPHVFQKPGAAPGLLVCHQRVCGLPQTDALRASAEIGRKLAI